MKNRSILTAVLLAVAACSDPAQPSGPGTSNNVVHVEAVRVTPQVIQLAAIGATKQVTVVVVPLDATDRAVTWESTDSAVATVDAGGLVTAKAAGAGVFVTAITHDGQRQASVNVSVTP